MHRSHGRPHHQWALPGAQHGGVYVWYAKYDAWVPDDLRGTVFVQIPGRNPKITLQTTELADARWLPLSTYNNPQSMLCDTTTV